MSTISQKDIDFVLNAGEGLKIEFKENLSQLDRTMVAFANAEGGRIFLGINKVPERTANYDLQVMVKKGVISKIGAARTARYIIR